MPSQLAGVLERTGVTAQEAEVAAWAVLGADRRKVGGARAVGGALSVGRNAAWPALPWKVPGLPWLLDRVYALIASNRYRLPGEMPWCDQHPGECTRDAP